LQAFLEGVAPQFFIIVFLTITPYILFGTYAAQQEKWPPFLGQPDANERLDFLAAIGQFEGHRTYGEMEGSILRKWFLFQVARHPPLSIMSLKVQCICVYSINYWWVVNVFIATSVSSNMIEALPNHISIV
jgi:hypothetical protein